MYSKEKQDIINYCNSILQLTDTKTYKYPQANKDIVLTVKKDMAKRILNILHLT